MSEKKKYVNAVAVYSLLDELDGMTVDEAGSHLIDLEHELSMCEGEWWKNIKLKHYGDYEYDELRLVGKRLETDEELKYRLRKEKQKLQRQQKKADKERKLYEELKKKYEGK